MWSRSDLKNYAKQLLSRSYGKILLISIIMSFASGAASGGSSYSSSGSGDGNEEFSAFIKGLLSGKSLSDAGKVFVGTFAIGIVIILFSIIAGYAIKIFVTNPIIVSAQRFFLMNRVDENAQIGEIGYAFKYSYMNIVKVMFFKDLFVWLWTLLLWVPGIIKSYEYRMIPYLLAENPNLTREEAFRISKKMMDGEKWNAFVLDLSFLGWYLLGLLTCGILWTFYVTPYHNLTNAELYVALKQKSNDPGVYQNYNQNYNQDPYDR